MWLLRCFLIVGLTVLINCLELTEANSCTKPPFDADLELAQNVKVFWKESNITITGQDDYSVLLAKDLKTPPHLSIPNLEGGRYIVFMEDPDAPYPDSKENKTPFQHWMKINVPVVDDQFDEGNVVLTYMGPSPPEDSEPHRYFIAVYKQTAHKDSQRDVPAGSNKHGKRSARNTLLKLGVKYKEPIAWACFKATSNETDAVSPTPAPEVSDDMKRLASIEPGSPEETEIKKQFEECQKPNATISCPNVPEQTPITPHES